jgi:DNA-binding transcriptional regulator YiaG
MSIKARAPAVAVIKPKPAKSSGGSIQRRLHAHAGNRAHGPAGRRGPEIGGVRSRLGLTQEELGRVMGYSTRSVAAWESGRQPLSASARLKLIEVDRLAAALAQIMSERAVGDWLRAPNSAFEGQRPLQLLERGEADRLWQMVHQIDANVAN